MLNHLVNQFPTVREEQRGLAARRDGPVDDLGRGDRLARPRRGEEHDPLLLVKQVVSLDSLDLSQLIRAKRDGHH
jgi:hypothetical protein